MPDKKQTSCKNASAKKRACECQKRVNYQNTENAKVKKDGNVARKKGKCQKQGKRQEKKMRRSERGQASKEKCNCQIKNASMTNKKRAHKPNQEK